MAKVWFVRRENRLVALGGQPAYEASLDALMWPLDLGLHRTYTNQPPVLDTAANPRAVTFIPGDMVLVELRPGDIDPGSSYTVGFYSSPYSPMTAIARLGEPWES